MASGSNWYQIESKTCYILKVSKFYIEKGSKKGSMLKGSKVSSVTCKCVFYRPELNAKSGSMELKFESLEKKHTNR